MVRPRCAADDCAEHGESCEKRPNLHSDQSSLKDFD